MLNRLSPHPQPLVSQRLPIPASDVFVLIAIATLPLTQALTVDVGFPLKISEIALLTAVPMRLTSLRARPRDQGQWIRRPRLLASLFILATILSLSYALTIQPDRPSDLGFYRFGPEVDGLLQLAYLILAVGAMLIVFDITRRRRDDVTRVYLRGAIAAAAYAIYANVGLPALPNASNQSAMVGGISILRAGTFLEGNFFGLYLLTALILALYARRPWIAALLSIGTLLSLSTPSIVFAVILWLIFMAQSAKTNPASLWAAIPIVAILLALPNSYFYSAILEKVSDPQSQSVVERKGSARAAVEMFRDHPLTGVGIAQYGLWFREYRPAFVPPQFLKEEERFVPNNVYAQVAAEQGLLGLIPFVGLLLFVLRTAWRSVSRLVGLGAMCVLLVLNAFPSSTVLFVWAFFGIVLGAAAHNPPLAPGASRHVRLIRRRHVRWR